MTFATDYLPLARNVVRVPWDRVGLPVRVPVVDFDNAAMYTEIPIRLTRFRYPVGTRWHEFAYGYDAQEDVLCVAVGPVREPKRTEAGLFG